MMLPANLASEWRQKAKELLRFGANEQALTLQCCADDLEESWRIWQTEPLTLEEAAEESGYSYSSLQKRVALGEIPNVGKSGAPRVQRQRSLSTPVRHSWELIREQSPVS